MPEAFDPSPLLRPGNLRSAATIDDGREIVEKLLTCDDGDLLADLMEHAVDKSERAHAVIFELLRRIRWPDKDERTTGIEFVGRMR